MSRLIDADELKADLRMADDCKDCKTNARDCEYDRVYTKMDFCAWLDDAPTVDAVPVVRCRNCRFSQRINDWVYYCYVFNVDKILNQYCDMGERKDGGDEKADRT